MAAADARLNLARTYYFNDQIAETYPPLRNALSELETLRQTDARNPEIGRLLAKGYALLGVTMFWDNKQAEGEAEITRALALSESLVAQNPNDNVVRQGLWHVSTQSSQFYQDSNAARAFELLAKALQLAEESVKSDPDNTQARQNLAKAATGEEQRRQHKQKAKENYQRALDLLLQLQAQNALAEYDRRVHEELRANVQK